MINSSSGQPGWVLCGCAGVEGSGNYGDELVSRYRSLSEEFYGTDRVLVRKQAFAAFPLGLVSVLVSSGALVYAMATTATAAAVGRLAAYTQAINLVQTSAHSVLFGIGELYRNVLFVGNVFEYPAAENIGFGSITKLADRERIRRAGRDSSADAFLSRLPDDYDPVLGKMFEGGRQLSIGQWQKVALARAFMRRAPLVVLDEPTASIDAEAEAEIFAR
ncbi:MULTISPECIES: ABC transporter ATP-binding protein [unclassified Streptomyces]|uniref:ABC transporter ATP-binding protein n=1 Tax=unclassified Streptomyces TaxID=2593676 RepID=UPI0033C2943D